MDHRLDLEAAKPRLDQAVRQQDRFVLGRNGEPSVLILGVEDFIRPTIRPPPWLVAAWEGARDRGVDTAAMHEIDAEVAAVRKPQAG